MATNDKGTTYEYTKMLRCLGACPITGGCVTRMEKDTFKEMCNYHKKNGRNFASGSGRAKNSICLKCNGKKPKELVFF